jgi:hypothetical protein
MWTFEATTVFRWTLQYPWRNRCGTFSGRQGSPRSLWPGGLGLRHDENGIHVSCALWAIIAGVFSHPPWWRHRPPCTLQRDRTTASIGMALLVH